ncbi:interleukin-6 receptor subunit alpha isoform X2 [Mesoplodon densirostris]|uniref:interleukin-6 receptor subunit alpha isoform X2 n=1 Tax=Mesoplodon densirostris TaxID=48708 RepID=UPI0028DBE74E|nr:interleukin-6 receptor subunit alpha isoform X2 [Mesoplodon densirostris]
MLAVRCALLTALLATPGTALAPGGCPALEVASDVLTSLPGASVTLTCPGGEAGDNATVHWVLRNQVTGSRQGRWAGVGRRLLLRSVLLSDSGNYSCYEDGRPAGSVRLLVDVPPEEPQLSCFRRSPLSKVGCEWSPRSPPSPTTKAVLLVKELQYHCIIHDAWSGMKHVVQLRAQEEFGHGLWSEWSQEVTGVPWTESKSSPAETELPRSTQAPTTNEDNENIFSKDSANATNLPVQNSTSVPLPTFLVAGGSLAFGTLLCIGIVLRFKKTGKLQALKEGKTSVHPPYSLGQLVPERPKPTPVLVPLISPPVSPSSLGSDNTSRTSRPDASGPQSPYDVSNRDYFFPR